MDQSQLEQIGSYVKNHIGQWIREQKIYPFPSQKGSISKDLLKRMVAVEKQLKFQNEKLELMLLQSGCRFEDLQKNMDQRFESVQLNMNQRF